MHDASFLRFQKDITMDYSVLSSVEHIPVWARKCFSYPNKGVKLFLQELCKISGAPYAHVRVLSRFGRFYTMAESIGPYKAIGWRRRFQLLDNMDEHSLAYEFLDYHQTSDCKNLERKYDPDSYEYKYLNSLTFGFWIPLMLDGITVGYVTLSWTEGKPEQDKVSLIKDFMSTVDPYVALLYSACRSIITDTTFADIWAASGIILSSPSEALCYDHIATACEKLWGSDATTYIGKVDWDNNCIEIVSVEGHRAMEARQLEARQNIPIGQGIMSFALSSERPVISFSLANEKRFTYHSMRSDGQFLGSAIAARLSRASIGESVAVISVEHEIENYFDLDDIRYINGVARIGFEALASHKKASERVAREIDTLFTQMSHDIAEPLQALVADADVLRYQASIATPTMPKNSLSEHMTNISNRASNIVETSLDLNKQVRKHLDAGIDGAASRIVEGKINLYRLLNSLVDTWEERAKTQGVEIISLFDSLRGIEVQCDETELKLSLGHLLGNAIKYSFWGRRKQQGTASKYGRYVNVVGRLSMGKAFIEFQNYGIGILKNERSKVKEKFYRGVLAKKEGRSGTGRGLWSANLFFESLGGGIDVNSEYKGSDPTSEDGPYFTVIKASIPYIASEEN